MANPVRIVLQVEVGESGYPTSGLMQEKIGGVGWQNVTTVAEVPKADFSDDLATALTAEFPGLDPV